jgi:YgiT-type zinc finger domain-containing protein
MGPQHFPELYANLPEIKTVFVAKSLRKLLVPTSGSGNCCVPNTPVEVCTNCDMIYYDAAVLKEIERRFFAIRKHQEQPDRYIQMPTASYL